MSFPKQNIILSEVDKAIGIDNLGQKAIRVNAGKYDELSGSLATIDFPHAKTHEGNAYYVSYSVPSLGAMTTPDDTITITFTTPATGFIHFTFSAYGSAGWRLRLIEAPTGGAATPTGQLAILNHNRASSNTSTVSNGTTAGQVNYDATLATGGTMLWDQYLEGSGGPLVGGTSVSNRNEVILKQNTVYQISLYGVDTNPATLYLDWYERY